MSTKMEEYKKSEVGEDDILEVGVGLLDPTLFVEVHDELLECGVISGLNCEEVSYDYNSGQPHNKRRRCNSSTVGIIVRILQKDINIGIGE